MALLILFDFSYFWVKKLCVCVCVFELLLPFPIVIYAHTERISTGGIGLRVLG
jgi:hypothetical protein